MFQPTTSDGTLPRHFWRRSGLVGSLLVALLVQIAACSPANRRTDAPPSAITATTDLRSPDAYAAVTPPSQLLRPVGVPAQMPPRSATPASASGLPPSLLIEQAKATEAKPSPVTTKTTHNKLFPALRDTPLARAKPGTPPERFEVSPALAPTTATPNTPPPPATSAEPSAASIAVEPESAPAIPVPAERLPPGYLLPQGMFSPPQSALPQATDEQERIPRVDLPASQRIAPQPRPALPEIVIYDSPATRRFLAAGGIDYQATLSVWTDFLERHALPHRVINQTEALNAATEAVWVFPSSIALSAEERRAVTQHRARGGSILASWLAGVRSENGAWVGFSFLEHELDTQVEGNTEGHAEHNFLMPYGDSPLSWQLPAGRRVFMERVPQWYPLRLKGRHTAAHLLNWSRTPLPDAASTAVLTYNERRGRDNPAYNSRSAVLGFPERLWSGDPKAMEALIRDTLSWLQRRPQAHLAAWPAPYRSALTVGIDVSEGLAKMAETHLAPYRAIGGKASIFALPEALDSDLQSTRPALPGLLAAGHELAYFGDRFAGYKDQDEATQQKRMTAMQQRISELLPTHPALRSFRAPMESYDTTTLQLLPPSVDQVVDGPGVSETRLPELRTLTEGFAPLVMLPRTLRPLDDLPESSALGTALSELHQAIDSGALTYVTLRSSGNFQADLWRLYLEQIAQHKGELWLATVAEVGHWWREREQISVSYDDRETPPLLSITVKGSAPLQHPVGVIITLPQAGSSVQAQPTGNSSAAVSAQRRSPWQTTLSFQGLPPGTHHWRLHFTASGSPLSKQLGLDAAGSLRLSN